MKNLENPKIINVSDSFTYVGERNDGIRDIIKQIFHITGDYEIEDNCAVRDAEFFSHFNIKFKKTRDEEYKNYKIALSFPYENHVDWYNVISEDGTKYYETFNNNRKKKAIKENYEEYRIIFMRNHGQKVCRFIGVFVCNKTFSKKENNDINIDLREFKRVADKIKITYLD